MRILIAALSILVLTGCKITSTGTAEPIAAAIGHYPELGCCER